jgi:hypothetical protein
MLRLEPNLIPRIRGAQSSREENLEMIDVTTLKSRHFLPGILGNILCKKFGMANCHFTAILVTPSPEGLYRIIATRDELIRAKSVIERIAVALGWSIGEVR